MAGGTAEGRARLSKVGRPGDGVHGICAVGKGMGAHFWGKIPLYLLPVDGGENRGKGYGKALLESCLADARAQGRSGVCMLGAAKQKAWLTDQSFFRHFGFETVDTTSNGYELLALSFDGTYPRFAPNVFKMKIEERELTVYYDDQCPFIPQTIEKLRKYCEEAGEPLTPCVMWTACRRRRSCPACSTTGRRSTVANF